MKLKPLVSLLALAFAAPAVLASSSGVVISQVYGSGGNTAAAFINDYVELFNAGSSPVSLSGWSIQYASATGSGNFSPTVLSGSLQPGQYYLVKLGSGGSVGAALPTQDALGSTNMSGTTGKVILANVAASIGCNGGSAACSSAQQAQIVDLVGWGSANYFEGAVGPGTVTANPALLRKNAGCTDTDNNASDFAIGAPLPRNSASPLNSCGATGPISQPILPSCPDGAATQGVATSFSVSASDIDSRVNSATLQSAAVAGLTLGSLNTAGSDGEAASLPINVSASVVPGTYPMTLQWGNDDAQTAQCTFKVVVAGTVSIAQIQGSGASSPMVGQTVSTAGVVTQVLNNGFYLQDPVGDGNDATSDGVFVYTAAAPTVAVGDSVSLNGAVAEYTAGSAAAGTLTELKDISGLSVLSSGNTLPQPVEIDLSSAPDLERVEGMRVHLHGGGAPLMVQQTNFLGAYGQLTLAAGGRLLNPTNVLRPGPAALELAASNKARSIILDDGSSQVNPNPTPYLADDLTVRAGDTLIDVTGVIDFGPATASASGTQSYKIHPQTLPEITRSSLNARTTAPAPVAGNVRVASANVLNYFTTFLDGTSVNDQNSTSQGCTEGSTTNKGNCRGADNLIEFNRQRNKILASLSAINADVVGLMEIQNNGNTAVQNLVDGLNGKMGAGTYAATPLPAQTGGTGSDAIRVAMIYKPGKLSLQGQAIADIDSVNNRPTYAQGFVAPNGEKFAVVVNHLKSKGSCSSGLNADQGDLQGCHNETRKQQATRLLAWLPTVTATAGTPDVILLGDFNAYALENPITVLTDSGQVVDLVSRFDPADYSYVFDAWAGRLDHGLGTPSIVPKITGAHSWHINADEPTLIDYNTDGKSVDYYANTAYRSSDHDPLILGLNLLKQVTGSAGRDTIIGTAGDDVITGGSGIDTLTGGAGRDQFVYVSMGDAGDTITDFVVGEDTLVLTKLLQANSIASADPLGQGYVTCTMSGANAIIGIDNDGSVGTIKTKPLLQLKGIACSAITASSFKF